MDAASLSFCHLILASDLSEIPLFDGKNEETQRLILDYFQIRQKNKMTFLPRSLLKFKANLTVRNLLKTLLSEECPPALFNSQGFIGINEIQHVVDGFEIGSDVWPWIRKGSFSSGDQNNAALKNISILDLPTDFNSDQSSLDECKL